MERTGYKGRGRGGIGKWTE